MRFNYLATHFEDETLIFGERVRDRCCQEQRKKKRKSKRDEARTFWYSKRKDKGMDFWAGARVMLRKEKITTHIFNFFAFILFTPL